MALSACASAPPAPVPMPGPDPDPGPVVIPAQPTPSGKSQKLTRYYGRLQGNLLTQGLLRTDGGGIDTPYTDTDLLRNFEQVVFYDEYAPGRGFKRSDGKSGALRKWTVPVRIAVEFGASVSADQRATDSEMIARYAARLSRITDHPISASNLNPNFYVMIMGEDDRAEALARIKQIVPGIDPSSLTVFRNLPRSTHCLVVAFSSPDNKYSYRRAIAFIRAEHPPLLRQSCIHEEIAQGLGLANDSPRARPSIFNDDDEFALLTTQDEDMLRLLYNPALSPGMTAAEARPILQRLILGQSGPS
ncbi:Tellurite resistance protein (telA) [hydrothermal vent metagenome]|uniref:Tellurite resistance protein (TelA) n=1 Tax=hydrothermal vent metagenome TaxID=652676 RepID=A0A3B0SJB6_9ZZZZ